jgi:two-component system, chemotaxis family, sensor kinase CheA
MDAYKETFLAESIDFVQHITDGLLGLEREPGDLAPVETIFRGAHSLKGMSAAMGYQRTADLTHAMEGLMSHVREGRIHVDQALIDLMLEAVDIVRELIDDETAGTSTVDPAETIDRLAELADRAAENPVETDEDIAPDFGLLPGERGLSVAVTLEEDCSLKGVRAYMAIKRLNQLGRVLRTSPSADDLEDERFAQSFTVILATASSDDAVEHALLEITDIAGVSVEEAEIQGATEHAAGAETASDHGRADRSSPHPRMTETHTVRVAIGHLDSLVDLVGELVILRSRFDQLLQRREEPELSEVVADLHRISAELQYQVLQTRMVPVGNIFNRFPRMVRDLAADLGKQVDFAVLGSDIELDRTVLDEIGDSIMHLLRNAIDHGIETSERRLRAGKPAAGVLSLSAARERDHVAIVVSDDGGGIDADGVWNEACRRGLARSDERAEYSDSDVLLFTCVPGFSTAGVTTRVSGRGVGLDVVKREVEALGGTLAIASSPGLGTEFTLRLPLMLAIVRALLVEVRGQTFALPLSAVNEVVSAAEIRSETIDGRPVMVGRDGDVVALVKLDSLLFGEDAGAPLSETAHVVTVVSAGVQYAVAVDGLLGRQEIVVKPLSGMFEGMNGLSGATIMGDGRVALILDPRTLFSGMEAPR